MSVKNNKLYRIWVSIKQRTSDVNHKDYKHYGARGIKNCFKDWSDFESWALSNGYSDGLQIDRRDNNGNYEHGNCRWVTPKVNSNNRRTNVTVVIEGRNLTVTEACELLNINRTEVYDAVHKGYWVSEQAYIDYRRQVNGNGQAVYGHHGTNA